MKSWVFKLVDKLRNEASDNLRSQENELSDTNTPEEDRNGVQVVREAIIHLLNLVPPSDYTISFDCSGEGYNKGTIAFEIKKIPVKTQEEIDVDTKAVEEEKAAREAAELKAKEGAEAAAKAVEQAAINAKTDPNQTPGPGAEAEAPAANDSGSTGG